MWSSRRSRRPGLLFLIALPLALIGQAISLSKPIPPLADARIAAPYTADANAIENLSSPYRPDGHENPNSLTEEKDDRPAPDNGADTLEHHHHLRLESLSATALTWSPLVASNAFRIPPIYRITQRIRL